MRKMRKGRQELRKCRIGKKTWRKGWEKKGRRRGRRSRRGEKGN